MPRPTGTTVYAKGTQIMQMHRVMLEKGLDYAKVQERTGVPMKTIKVALQPAKKMQTQPELERRGLSYQHLWKILSTLGWPIDLSEFEHKRQPVRSKDEWALITAYRRIKAAKPDAAEGALTQMQTWATRAEKASEIESFLPMPMPQRAALPSETPVVSITSARKRRKS